jgi:hypothetical protein
MFLSQIDIQTIYDEQFGYHVESSCLSVGILKAKYMNKNQLSIN